jgi:hypothetical protein
LIRIDSISIPPVIIELRKVCCKQSVGPMTRIGAVIYLHSRAVRYWRKSSMTFDGLSPSSFHGCPGEFVEYPQAMVARQSTAHL